jgi:hypothetical protein
MRMVAGVEGLHRFDEYECYGDLLSAYSKLLTN